LCFPPHGVNKHIFFKKEDPLMKKTLALLLALVMVLSVASFASAEGGKVVSLFLGGGTPLSMDPALNSASAGSNIIRSAFSG
jgi:hypothetical protein